MLVEIRGAGDIATGIALRLHRAGMEVVMCDLPVPTSIRRTVCFSEAIRMGETSVEGVRGVLCADVASARAAARSGDVAVLVDPEAASAAELAPDVLVDAILAKRNLGTRRDMAPVVIGVGPGFTARVDCDAAVETMRGHYLGRVYYEGSPLPNTAVPGLIGGYAGERVMRAPADGAFEPCAEIGAEVRAGDVCATVAGEPMRATIDGVVRGLLQDGVRVTAGMKCGDVDPRCRPEYIRTVSDKASAVGGGVLEAILALTARARGERDARPSVVPGLGSADGDLGERDVRPSARAARQAPVSAAGTGGTLSDPCFVSAVRDELAAGRSVATASLLATRGSMPRHEGARLAALADGRLLGTVGGGNVERVAEARAKDALAGAPASLEWLTRDKNDMACGGDALLAVRLLSPDDLPALEVLLAALTDGRAAAVIEDWSDPSAPALLASAEAPLPQRASWDEGGATYREPVLAPATCHVFGAGHVGTALVRLLPALGYRAAVYDDRPDAANSARLPDAATVTCGPFADIAKSAPVGPRDAVVVLTHGHLADEDVLACVLTRPVQPAYVGCIGSRRKAALVRERLVAAGVPSERAAALHLPIGEDILAATSQEIAVSIAAQLIRCRSERRSSLEEGKAS